MSDSVEPSLQAPAEGRAHADILSRMDPASAPAARPAAGGRKPAQAILSPLHKASRQVELHLEPACQEFGVTFREAHILAFLSSYPSKVTVLHRVFDLKKSTLTGILDRLEKLKLIERRLDPDDRRSFLVSVTDEGRRVAERIGPAVFGFEQSVLNAVSEEDYLAFQRVLKAIGEVTRVQVRPETPRTGEGGDGSA